jgi:hypothetical protein
VADIAPGAPPDAELFDEHPGRLYRRLWAAHLETMSAVDTLLGDLHARESRAVGDGLAGGRRAFGVTTPREANRLLREQAVRIVEALVATASVRFTPRGFAPVGISPVGYVARFIDEACMEPGREYEWERRFRPDQFDPGAVWDALLADWGGTAAEEAICRGAARSIEEYFRLTPDQPVQTRRNGVVLETSIYLDSQPVPAHAKRLHYNSHDDLRRFMDALKTFAIWAGDDELAAVAPKVAGYFDMYDYQIESRKRETITPRVVVTTYHTKFAWWLEQSLAEQLQIFLGLYGERMRSAIREAAA